MVPLIPYPVLQVTVTGPSPNRTTPLDDVTAFGIASGTRHGFPETNNDNSNVYASIHLFRKRHNKALIPSIQRLYAGGGEQHKQGKENSVVDSVLVS